MQLLGEGFGGFFAQFFVVVAAEILPYVCVCVCIFCFRSTSVNDIVQWSETVHDSSR